MKKIILGILLVGTMAFGCSNENEHNIAEDALNANLMFVVDGEVRMNNGYMYFLKNKVVTGEMSENEAKLIAADLFRMTENYVKNHR